MKGQTAVFVVEDETSYRCLEPIADRLSERNEVEFLFLDSLFEPPGAVLGEYKLPKEDVTISKSDVPYPYTELANYVAVDYHLFENLQPHYVNTLAQRFLTDAFYDRIYEFDAFFQRVDPDLLVSGVDHLPFLRQLIYEARQRDVSTAVVQQGIHRNHLDPEKVEGFLPHLAASYSPRSERLERLKRRFLYRFGPTTYTNPYPDLLFTLGGFFTRHIGRLRGRYLSDYADIVTAGSPEFEGSVSEYTPRAESVLFLGQQLFERREWWHEDERRFHLFLSKLNDQRKFTYRPHPKSSPEKLSNLPDGIDISNVDSLAADIERHDVILTFFSTAIYQGVIRGKVCGIVQLPWFPVAFPPFEHDHMVQVKDPTMDFAAAAAERSAQTQQQYLSEYCYMPSDDESVPQDRSTELIVETLTKRS